MAIATPESYADMIDRAKAGKYAIPAINVTSSQTLSAALKGFADAESDGIIQVSNGGAAYWSGSSRADRVKGSLALSAYANAVADLYPVGVVALHTDHCPRKLVDVWLKPLLEIEIEQAKRGEPTAFQSHMWDWKAVGSPRLACSISISRRGLSQTSTSLRGQWSVWRATTPTG